MWFSTSVCQGLAEEATRENFTDGGPTKQDHPPSAVIDREIAILPTNDHTTTLSKITCQIHPPIDCAGHPLDSGFDSPTSLHRYWDPVHQLCSLRALKEINSMKTKAFKLEINKLKRNPRLFNLLNHFGDIPPPPPPPIQRPGASGSRLTADERQVAKLSIIKQKISKQVFFDGGHFPLSSHNELVFVRHDLNGGLPVDPGSWGFLTVSEHVERGLTLHPRASHNFQKEFKRLSVEKASSTNEASHIAAICRHSISEYNRLKDHLSLVFKKSYP
ncbi:hypothetical protein BC829DRAFT_424244 [Chytridium lagenaria]|nr:hypothetical protein BC829DRAFT_424244 [Chytridium lagenaria]